MKKTFLALLFVTSLYFASAQSDAKTKKVQDAIGFSLGSTYSSFTGEDADDHEYLLGLEIDAFVMMSIAPQLFFIPGLDFSMMGAGYEDVDDLVIRLSYLYFSTLGRYQSAGGFFAETGPRVGALLAAKQKYDDESEDIKDELKGIDFGWLFGLGMEFGNTRKIGVQARFIPGLVNIIKDDEGEIKNTAFVLRLYVRI